MNGQEFLRIAGEAFGPFLSGLGFVTDKPSISGRHYRISFTSAANTILVSYEPGDDALFVIVFGRKNDELTDIDDRTKTPRLGDLNRRFMATITNEERAENERAFESIATKDDDGRALLKAAKDLRLVLPRYLRS